MSNQLTERLPIYDIPCENCKTYLVNTTPAHFPKTLDEWVTTLKMEELLLTTRNKFKMAKKMEKIYKEMVEISEIHAEGSQIDAKHDCSKYKDLFDELEQIRKLKSKQINPIRVRQSYKTQENIKIKTILEHTVHNKKIIFKIIQKGFEIPLFVQLPIVMEEQNAKKLEKYMEILLESSKRKHSFLKKKLEEAK